MYQHQLIFCSKFVNASRFGAQDVSMPTDLVLYIYFEVIDRESSTTGVWVLDWVIYNQIINEISSLAREVDQVASSWRLPGPP